jgi:hypothetical protein
MRSSSRLIARARVFGDRARTPALAVMQSRDRRHPRASLLTFPPIDIPLVNAVDRRYHDLVARVRSRTIFEGSARVLERHSAVRAISPGLQFQDERLE